MYNFDASATTAMDEQCIQIYQQVAQQGLGNTNSLHDLGGHAFVLVEKARQQLAQLLGAQSEEIYFTGSGTEGNLLAITQIAKGLREKGQHIIMSQGEHPSVDSAVAFLTELGFTVTSIPFQKDGRVDGQQIMEAIQQDTVLLIVQHVNSELGTIQPIEKIGSIAKTHNIHLHVDCVQSFGELDCRLVTKTAHSLTIASHKIYGPAGIAAVWIRKGTPWQPLFPGLTQEQGFRGGTHATASIVSFVAAAQFAVNTMEERYSDMWHKRRYCIQQLQRVIPKEALTIYEATTAAHQLPHILGLGIYPIEGQELLLACNAKGLAISTGSACQVGMDVPSKAMYALQVPLQAAKEFIRISFDRTITLEKIDSLIATLAATYQARIRG